MTQTLEGRALELIKDRNCVTLATTRKDGTIMTIVAWADADDDGRIVVNSAEGRAWPTNVRRTGRATIHVTNPQNPMEFVSVSGKVVEDTNDGAVDVINHLSHKYTGSDFAWMQPGEVRVTFRLQPERVNYINLGG